MFNPYESVLSREWYHARGTPSGNMTELNFKNDYLVGGWIRKTEARKPIR